MATVYSVGRTNNRATPTVMNPVNKHKGRIRVMHDVYEASSLASGDVIEKFIMPNNARSVSYTHLTLTTTPYV